MVSIELLRKKRKEKKRAEEKKRKRGEKIRKQAAKLLRQKRKEEFELARAIRRTALAEAKTKAADAQTRKKKAEAEVWRARRAKWGAILQPPRLKTGDREKAGKAVKKTAKGLAEGWRGLQKWARSGREEQFRDRNPKRKTTKKTTMTRKTVRRR